jgi:hypothetical protein
MKDNLQHLVGKTVEMGVSDPWEFETETGTGKMTAKVLQIGREILQPGNEGSISLLLHVVQPVKYKGVICEFFVASPRHSGKDFTLLDKMAVPCAFTLIPPERAESNNPFDLSWWRGGIGLIGGLGLK